MPRVLSYPFRLAGDGGVATVDAASDTADVEEVAVLLLTVRGERALVPGYGIDDPAFGGLRAPEVISAVTRWVPVVTVTDVAVTPESDTTQRAKVTLR